VSDTDPGLTIGVLSAATGVSPAVLRSWEQRHGFPNSTRTAAGHRRYPPDAADRVADVLRHRASGYSLTAAIDAVSRRVDRTTGSFAELLERQSPHLRFERITPRSMLALSRAIEDECCARADHPMVAGAFQTEATYRRNEMRWRSIAVTAAAAIVFADFAEPSPARAMPIEVPLATDAQTRREWVVICDAPGRSACLVGWEHPRDGHRSPRRFEATWSTEPLVVRAMSTLAIDLAAAHDPGHGTLVELLRPPDDDPNTAVRLATTLTGRLLADLDAPQRSRARSR
jgi:DICT domain-containing protein